MQKISPFSLKTQIALIVTITLWASAFAGIRVGLEGYSPGPLALLRFLIASACMVGILFYRRKKTTVKMQKKDLYWLVVVGALGLGGYNVALNHGELTIPSGVASFIISQSPLLTMIFAVLFLKETFSGNGLLGILISIVGVALITLGESHGFQFDIGILYVLIATLLGGLFSVMQKPFLTKYHAIDVTAYIIWGCTLSLILFFPALCDEIKNASLRATLGVVYLGIFPGAIAYIGWSYALSAFPASKAVSFLYFMPVIATFLGWIFLGEVLEWLSLIGGGVALLGVWVANRK